MQRSTILLVDDEPGLLDVCREALGEKGHFVLAAGNGREALSVLEHEKIDCVVCDLRMPEMGGMDLLRESKRRGIDAEFIFLTGYGCVSNAVECLQLGAVDYMLKPFGIEDLAVRVDKALGERRLRASPGDGLGLSTVMGLGQALRARSSFSGQLKEFLSQVRGTFAPDVMTFFFPSNDGRRPVTFRANALKNGILSWWGLVAERVLELGKPRLFDPKGLAAAARAGRDMPAAMPPMSLMIAPLVNGSERIGASVVIRLGEDNPYSMGDLQLLSFFCSHAAAVLDCTAKHRQIEDLNMGVITSLVRAVEAKDPYTCGHSERVAEYAVALGEAFGLSRHERELVRIAGLLHDIGKIGVPDSILNKPEGLTQDEYDIMQRHPAIGRDIISRVAVLDDVLPLIYHHHERMDGSGYPDRLMGDNIPLLSRIISVADGYEAMVSNRAYRNGLASRMAMETLLKGAGSPWDRRIVEVFGDLVTLGRVQAPVLA